MSGKLDRRLQVQDAAISRENSELAPGRVRFRDVMPPELAVRLDAWGLVVAHRAGVLARAKFSDSARRLKQWGLKGHKGLRPTPLELAEHWRMTEGVTEWPPATLKGGLGGSRSNPSDPPAVAIGYWDVVKALDGELLLGSDGNPQRDRFGRPKYRIPQASRQTQMVVAWCWAVPRYVGSPQDEGSLVIAKRGNLDAQARARWQRTYEDDLDRWLVRACRILRIRMEGP